MPTVTVHGTSLYYEIHGEGEPLLLISGLASDSQSWPPVLAPLSLHHRLIAPDNRGSGRTPLGTPSLRVERMAEDCLALLDHLSLPRVSVLGHYLGGYIAQRLAIRWPDRVNRLILAGTAASTSERNAALLKVWRETLGLVDREGWWRNLFAWILSRRFFSRPDDVAGAVRLALDYPFATGDEAFKAQAEAIAAFDNREEAASIGAKTLVLCGGEDIFIPPDESEELHRLIPGSLLSILPGAAHSLHLENPEGFCSLVLEFLKSS